MRRLNCHKAEALLTRELDEGLKERERILLEEHLNECLSCRQLKQQILAMFEAIASDVPHDLGKEYWDRYYSSLDAKLQEKESVRGWGIGWKVGMAAAVAALTFILVHVTTLDDIAPSPLSAEKQLAVIQELHKLYGPVNGTYEHNGVEISETQSQKYPTMTLPQDVLVTWFEVEDELSG